MCRECKTFVMMLNCNCYLFNWAISDFMKYAPLHRIFFPLMHVNIKWIPVYIFVTKIFWTDLTLSTHYKYRKLVRFHHKFHLKFFPTLQLSRSRVNLLQESQYRKKVAFFLLFIIPLFFLLFIFSPTKISLTYVCVRVCKTSGRDLTNTYENWYVWGESDMISTGSKWLISVLSDSTKCSNKVDGSGSDDWHLLAHQLDRTNLTKAYTSRRQRSPSFCALGDTGPVRRWNGPPRGWRGCSRSPLGPTLPSSRSSTGRFRRSKTRPITRSQLRRSPSRYRLCLLVWSTFSNRLYPP